MKSLLLHAQTFRYSYMNSVIILAHQAVGSPGEVIKYSHDPGSVPSFFVCPQVKTSPPKTLGQSKLNFVFIDWVFVMGRGGGQMHMLHTLIGGRQMPILSLGAEVLPCQLLGGGGGRCPHIPFFIGCKCPRGICPTLLLQTIKPRLIC